MPGETSSVFAMVRGTTACPLARPSSEPESRVDRDRAVERAVADTGHLDRQITDLGLLLPDLMDRRHAAIPRDPVADLGD